VSCGDLYCSLYSSDTHKHTQTNTHKHKHTHTHTHTHTMTVSLGHSRDLMTIAQVSYHVTVSVQPHIKLCCFCHFTGCVQTLIINLLTHYTHTALGNLQIKMKLISNESTDVYIPT